MRLAAAKGISMVAAIWQLCQTWVTNRRKKEEEKPKNTTKAFHTRQHCFHSVCVCQEERRKAAAHSR